LESGEKQEVVTSSDKGKKRIFPQRHKKGEKKAKNIDRPDGSVCACKSGKYLMAERGKNPEGERLEDHDRKKAKRNIVIRWGGGKFRTIKRGVPEEKKRLFGGTAGEKSKG